jgi:hypothetical protein
MVGQEFVDIGDNFYEVKKVYYNIIPFLKDHCALITFEPNIFYFKKIH